MYFTNGAFEEPAADARLWRYMDFVKFVALLESAELYFSRADLLGDAWEGSLPVPLASLRGTPLEAEGPVNTWNLSHSGEHVRYRTYVSCWHESEHESAAMWRLYGGESRSVAITTSFRKFAAAFGDDPMAQGPFAAKVRYVDYATATFSVNNGFLPFVHKRQSFEHEREVRAMFTRSAISDADRDKHDPSVFAQTRPAGIGLPVDLSLLIEAIRVDPAAPSWFSDLVSSVATRYVLSAPIERSAMSTDPLF
ncbi:DUF2971 domain-containing protein [Herbiconiux liukaitaii]|uniref:DUF2971 domain-containing protein n=1 Tax=Herbiconiux liukaitaii TaxID=3342799 RepID=UPI0035BB022E